MHEKKGFSDTFYIMLIIGIIGIIGFFVIAASAVGGL